MAKYRKTVLTEISEPWYQGVSDLPYVVSYLNQVPESQRSAKCTECDYLWVEHGSIRTLEGDHIVCPGDRLATGVQGEHWPIKPDIFAATYEKVE